MRDPVLFRSMEWIHLGKSVDDPQYCFALGYLHTSKHIQTFICFYLVSLQQNMLSVIAYCCA